MIDSHHGWNQSNKPLIVALILSIVMILTAYFLTVFHALPRDYLEPLIVVLGFLQAGFQLIYFMHLGVESKPRWNLMTFFFMILVIFLVIGGSVWIMHHLDYNVMMDMGH